jgi:hypothetical protein
VSDIVNHPKHYKASNGIEAIEVVEGFDLGFRKGNAVTYILRCDKKCQSSDVKERHAAAIEDLKKARWYIDREIADLEMSLAFWKKFDRDVERNNRKFEQRKRKR